ncbi:hypothetical protein COCVIDRAFT_84936 [Bipolaris victoriae FI3]|uniref:Uncharacterized protein n=1 Tax=Bipolaris victoriae (strain FI3) TaxID=930091 RepID=W7EWC2_BIPV3|nr:hypothetical protein COCVIDRAFT_84936 [Bipolaris victoriae FI3]
MDEAETRSDVLSRCKREETGTQACGDTTRVWTWWLGEGGREGVVRGVGGGKRRKRSRDREGTGEQSGAGQKRAGQDRVG